MFLAGLFAIMSSSSGDRPRESQKRRLKMARTARVKKTCDGTAYYHLMSRTNDKIGKSTRLNSSH